MASLIQRALLPLLLFALAAPLSRFGVQATLTLDLCKGNNVSSCEPPRICYDTSTDIPTTCPTDTVITVCACAPPVTNYCSSTSECPDGEVCARKISTPLSCISKAVVDASDVLFTAEDTPPTVPRPSGTPGPIWSDLGEKEKGDSCSEPLECGSGLFCLSFASDDSSRCSGPSDVCRCVPPGTGTPCSTSAQCAVGASCISVGNSTQSVCAPDEDVEDIDDATVVGPPRTPIVTPHVTPVETPEPPEPPVIPSPLVPEPSAGSSLPPAVSPILSTTPNPNPSGQPPVEPSAVMPSPEMSIVPRGSISLGPNPLPSSSPFTDPSATGDAGELDPSADPIMPSTSDSVAVTIFPPTMEPSPMVSVGPQPSDQPGPFPEASSEPTPDDDEGDNALPSGSDEMDESETDEAETSASSEKDDEDVDSTAEYSMSPDVTSPGLSPGAPSPTGEVGGEGDDDTPIVTPENEICIGVKHLGEHEHDLVYRTHRLGKVLCDAFESCATPGHIVEYNGEAMMMSTYCDRISTGCRAGQMLVNSVRYGRGKRVKSLSPGMTFTSLAARFETKLEERVLLVAMRRLGL